MRDRRGPSLEGRCRTAGLLCPWRPPPHHYPRLPARCPHVGAAGEALGRGAQEQEEAGPHHLSSLSTPVHLSRPSSAGPCSPAERGVSRKVRLRIRGPVLSWVEASAGQWGNGSREPPGEVSAEPTVLVKSPLQLNRRGPELRKRAHLSPKPGYAPPHAWCCSTLHPPRNARRRSPSPPQRTVGSHCLDSWARGWRMPGEGGLLELIGILCRGSLGASWKGAPGARWQGGTGSPRLEWEHLEPDGREHRGASWKGAPRARWRALRARRKGSTQSQMEEYREPDGRGALRVKWKGSTGS